MGQMAAGIFRPGAGQTIRWFVAAVAEETIYPHDWVAISSTATSGQGPAANGIFESETLGTNDFIYVALAVTTLTGIPGTECGVAMGSGIGAVSDITNVGSNSVTADNVLIIQNFGVHPMVRTDGNATAAVEYLTIGTTAGVADASATIHASDHGNVGIALATDGAYTRAAAATGGAAWIRCI